jgi:hypothetical protein
VGNTKLANEVDANPIQRFTLVDLSGAQLLLTGFNTATYTNLTVQSATPTAWTTGNSPITLWTVTGTVLARVFGVVGGTALTSTGNTGTLSVGNSGNVTLFLPTSTVSAAGGQFAINVPWLDATPTVLGKVLVATTLTWAAVGAGTITLTVATNSMTAGAMTLYCQWVPLTSGATVV